MSKEDERQADEEQAEGAGEVYEGEGGQIESEVRVDVDRGAIDVELGKGAEPWNPGGGLGYKVFAWAVLIGIIVMLGLMVWVIMAG